MTRSHPDVRPDLATEDDIERLVRDFYREAAVDDLLGPVFAAAEVDWAEHIPKVTAFWAWQLIGGRRYDGRPLRAHERVNQLVPFTDAHYERWLELFTDTLHESWSGPVAELAQHRARLMARSMRRVLAGVDDPDPTWAEEDGAPDPGVVPTGGEGSEPQRGGSGGLVLPVAMGRRPSPSPPSSGSAPGPGPEGRPGADR